MRSVGLLSGLLLVLEACAVTLTLGALFRPPAASWVALGLAVAGLVVAVWVTLTVRSVRQISLLARRIAAEPGTVTLEDLHRVRQRVGIQTVGHLLAAAAGGSGLLALFAGAGGTPPTEGLAFLGVSVTAVLLVEAWRPTLFARPLRTLADALPTPGQGEAWRRDTLRWDLQWTSLATSSAGILGVALFIYFFIPVSALERRMLMAYYPPALALVGLLWYLLTARLLRPLVHALGSSADEGSGTAALAAFRSAQILPYTLAGTKALAFFGAGGLLYLEAVLLVNVDREHAVFMAGATVLAAFAAGLYEAFWHRTTIRPVLAHLAGSQPLDFARVRSPLSLRVKMFGGFGLVLFFACAIAIFWSFLQVRTLAVAFVQKQAKLKAEAIAELLKTQDKVGDPVNPEDVGGLLAQLSGTGEEIYWYLPPSGPPERYAAVGQRPPPLPVLARARMRQRPGGELRLADQGFVGAFLQLRIGKRHLGAVAVLYPDQTRRSPASGPQAAVLVVFFLVILGLSIGIVALITTDLSAPLRTLEQRAGEMARGDLQHPVVTGSEADEVGRLAFVLDEMRRSLETQIRTIEELNVGLEAKVTLRTADLERANHDLQAALDSLTRAQDQLVRSEKLASIGQLVAGIAHELNNPVNAISNSLTPLQQALTPVLEGTSGADLAALREDLPAMLRVIRNGAQRIQRIVSALSSYSRTRSDQAERVDLPQLLDETLDLAWHLLVGVKVERQYAPEARVEGHRGELGQVLMNLVANAAQAVAGRPDPWIGATVEIAGDEVRVTVADSGPGVPAEVRARIFDPFFTTKPVGQGTGLGLSISHEIVTEHRGRIEVADRPEGGATFTVVLPAFPGIVGPP